MEMPRVAMFDIDGTMFNGFSYFPLLDTQVAAGLVEAKYANYAADILERYKDARLSYEDFVMGLIDIYAQGLQGKPVDEVAQSTDEFFEASTEFFGYVGPTINLLTPTHEIVLVTGNTQFTASAVAKVFGVQQFCSSMLGIEKNRVTGKAKSYLATRQEKGEAIHGLIPYKYSYKGSFAFGDSESDIQMLQAVEYPVFINPTTGLREAANDYGFPVIDSHSELNSKQALAVVQLSLDVNK